MSIIACVTGGSGFIGKKLVKRLLTEGYRVRVLTRCNRMNFSSNIEIFIGDISQEIADYSAFFDGADLLFHCAGQLHDGSQLIKTNIGGVEKLIVAAEKKVRRWVQLSSVGVYGSNNACTVSEDTTINPSNVYEFSKAEADRLVINAASNGAFECTIVRPSNVFGVGMPNTSLIQLAEVIRRQWFFFIGPEGSSANYIPVENVVDALMLCATHSNAANKIYNISDWMAMEEFIAAVAIAQGVPVPRRRFPLGPVRVLSRIAGCIPGSPLTISRVDALTGRTRYPCDRIEAELGYRHRQTLTEALNAMFRGPCVA